MVSTLLGNYRVNPAKGIGHYNDLTSDSCVVEERYWVNDSLTNTTALEKEWFGIKIENHDVMYQTNVNSKERVRWMRSNTHKLNYLYHNILGRPDTTKSSPILPLKEFNDKTLFVLKSETKSVVVTPNKAFPKPFIFMKDDKIEMMENLLNSDGLKEYGEKARYGALVIWVSEDYYEEALKTLKAHKNVF